MAKETKMISGRMFTVHPLYRNVADASGKETKYRASAMVPVAPPFVNDDDAANWLAEAVEDGTFGWQQIVKWVLAQIPIDAGGVAFSGLTNPSKKTFNVSDIERLFTFLQPAKDALGNKADDPALLRATMERMYRDSQKADPRTWNPNEHVVFPSDIR